jgi:hypothetical protein
MPEAPMPGEPSAIGAALRALDRTFTEQLNRGDVQGLAEAYYVEDADVLPPNAPPSTWPRSNPRALAGIAGRRRCRRSPSHGKGQSRWTPGLWSR